MTNICFYKPPSHISLWRVEAYICSAPGALGVESFSTQIQGVRGLQNDFHKKLDGMQRLHKRCLGSVHGACGETGEQ